jgi:hypothetical protein
MSVTLRLAAGGSVSLTLHPPTKSWETMTRAERRTEDASLAEGRVLKASRPDGTVTGSVIVGAPIDGQTMVPVIAVSASDPTHGARHAVAVGDAAAALSQT